MNIMTVAMTIAGLTRTGPIRNKDRIIGTMIRIATAAENVRIAEAAVTIDVDPGGRARRVPHCLGFSAFAPAMQVL